MPIRIQHSPQLEEKTYFAYRGLEPFPLVNIGSLSYGCEFFVGLGEPSQVKIGRCSSIAQGVHFLQATSTTLTGLLPILSLTYPSAGVSCASWKVTL